MKPGGVREAWCNGLVKESLSSETLAPSLTLLSRLSRFRSLSATPTDPTPAGKVAIAHDSVTEECRTVGKRVRVRKDGTNALRLRAACLLVIQREGMHSVPSMAARSTSLRPQPRTLTASDHH